MSKIVRSISCLMIVVTLMSFVAQASSVKKTETKSTTNQNGNEYREDEKISRLPAETKALVQVDHQKETRAAKKIKASLDQACSIFRDGVKESMDPKKRDHLAELRRRLGGRIESEVKHNSVLQIWRNMSLADPKDKRAFWEMSAQDLGVKSWACPEIGEFFNHVEQ